MESKRHREIVMTMKKKNIGSSHSNRKASEALASHRDEFWQLVKRRIGCIIEAVRPSSLYACIEDLGRALTRPMADWFGSPARIKCFKQVNLWICLPPLAEQREIVRKLDDLQWRLHSLQQLQTETSAELDALMPSILDKAFRGEL
jgi:hypothetical protein